MAASSPLCQSQLTLLFQNRHRISKHLHTLFIGILKLQFHRDLNLQQELLKWFFAKIAQKPSCALAVFEGVLKLDMWKLAASKIGELGEPPMEVRLAFQSHWITSAHCVREQIADDEKTAELIRQMMPLYEGGNKELYRGESKWNWDNGQIGFCWTDKLTVAKTFAGGLHNGEFGAVIIKGSFRAGDIIAGVDPNQTHSIRDEEREFTIDPFCDVLVEAIECHGPYDETGNSKPNWPLPDPVTRKCQR